MQQSIASLPEDKQEAAMESTVIASRDYPSVVVNGCTLHICQIDGEWQIWLNTEDADWTGVCISAGHTRDEAVSDAVKTLEDALEILQGPPEA